MGGHGLLSFISESETDGGMETILISSDLL